uniref:Sulfatase N-terminal domain-containing protein n=2 Tax=Arion vulgaris TaxID=1028688 RepID=A0A0B7A305_9EUPU
MGGIMFVQIIIVLLCACVQGKQPPNVLFILADDLGWDDIGFHGSEIQTPNIDRLAYEGVILDNYYVQPMCTPTRGALLTGRYPIHTGLQHCVILGSDPYGLPLTEITLAQHLKHLGYSTHIVGKWHVGFFKKEYLPENRGFDSHLGYYLGLGDYYTHYSQSRDIIGYDFHKNGQALWDQDGVYATDIFTAQAENIIRTHNKSKPLFLYLAHQAVHAGNENDPIQVPQKYVDRFPYIKDIRRRMFAGVVSALDDSIGAVHKALQETGLLNTLIIFSTDNGGPPNWSEDNAAFNWPLRGGKMTLWQGGVRGVGFIHSPLLQKQGYVNSNLMHVVDWLPTIYNLAGGNPSDLQNIDGIDQTDVILKNAATNRTEVLLNIDPIDKNEALIFGDYKIIFGDISGGQYDGWYKPPQFYQYSNVDLNSADCDQEDVHLPVIVDCGQKPEYASVNCQPEEAACLYNIREDPCEYNNLAESLPNVVAELQERINVYRSTMIPPGNKPIDPAGYPQFHGGVWQPWL